MTRTRTQPPPTAAHWLEAVASTAEHARRQNLEAEAKLREQVGLARTHGATWADVGQALGVTRSAAQQRYGDRSAAA